MAQSKLRNLSVEFSVKIPLNGGMQLKIEKLTHYGVTIGFGNITVE